MAKNISGENIRMNELDKIYPFNGGRTPQELEEARNELIFTSGGARKNAMEEIIEARKLYETARAKFIAEDYVKYFRIAIFGSARLENKDPAYEEIVNLSKKIVKERPIDIVTGGGPGIMKAAHEGLLEAKGENPDSTALNHGLTITLPFEEEVSATTNIHSHHPEFSSRLQEFMDIVKGSYNAEGGIGTLLEQMIIAQSKQVGHLESNFKILANPFWRPILDKINDELYHQRLAEGRVPLISEKDLKLIQIVEIEEAVQIFRDCYDWWHKNINSRVRRDS